MWLKTHMGNRKRLGCLLPALQIDYYLAHEWDEWGRSPYACGEATLAEWVQHPSVVCNANLQHIGSPPMLPEGAVLQGLPQASACQLGLTRLRSHIMKSPQCPT